MRTVCESVGEAVDAVGDNYTFNVLSVNCSIIPGLPIFQCFDPPSANPPSVPSLFHLLLQFHLINCI
jgi:hypothetical protein